MKAIIHKKYRTLLASIAIGFTVPAGTALASDLAIALGSSITSLDPHFANNSPNKAVARHFFEALKKQATLLRRFRAASIGPLTSETLRGYGCPPDAEAPVHTLEGLLDAMEGYISGDSE